MVEQKSKQVAKDYTVNNYRQVIGMVTGENFAFFIYRHFVERSIFQTFWKPDFGARFLFIELDTSNFGSLLVFYFAELCKVWERLDNIYVTHFTRVPPFNVFLFFELETSNFGYLLIF